MRRSSGLLQPFLQGVEVRPVLAREGIVRVWWAGHSRCRPFCYNRPTTRVLSQEFTALRGVQGEWDEDGLAPADVGAGLKPAPTCRV